MQVDLTEPQIRMLITAAAGWEEELAGEIDEVRSGHGIPGARPGAELHILERARARLLEALETGRG